jgi:hypothetical protein
MPSLRRYPTHWELDFAGWKVGVFGFFEHVVAVHIGRHKMTTIDIFPWQLRATRTLKP